MDQRKEEQFLRKRFIDLARNAYHREQCVYTDFLNTNEISIFHSMVHELPDMPYSVWGGVSRCRKSYDMLSWQLNWKKGRY